MKPQHASRPFSELMALAHLRRQNGNYYVASIGYWGAAHVALTFTDEWIALQWAWICLERSEGRVSELEAAA